MDYFSSGFAGKVPVLDLADIYCGVPEQLLAVQLQCTDVISILVCDKDLPDRCGINIQPPHLFSQPLIVVSRINHDCGAILRVKENVGNPLTHAGHVLIDPSGIQRFENRLATEQPAHGFLLVF